MDPEDHKNRITRSANGLGQVSDIHFCSMGHLSINNLHIDQHWAVRSFSLMELPEAVAEVKVSRGIPMPTQKATSNLYRITSMLDDEEGYRLILTDSKLNITINVGEVLLDEVEVASFASFGGQVKLRYFESDIKLRGYHEMWFTEFVNALEELPPTRLGLFVEALRFLWNVKQKPTEFEVEQLRTLLSSHNTTFMVQRHNYKVLRNITNKYGAELREPIDKLLRAIKENRDMTLQDIQVVLQEELAFLIYLAIILEQGGALKIHRSV